MDYQYNRLLLAPLLTQILSPWKKAPFRTQRGKERRNPGNDLWRSFQSKKRLQVLLQTLHPMQKEQWKEYLPHQCLHQELDEQKPQCRHRQARNLTGLVLI